jgi:hypothetical protein
MRFIRNYLPIFFGVLEIEASNNVLDTDAGSTGPVCGDIIDGQQKVRLCYDSPLMASTITLDKCEYKFSQNAVDIDVKVEKGEQGSTKAIFDCDICGSHEIFNTEALDSEVIKKRSIGQRMFGAKWPEVMTKGISGYIFDKEKAIIQCDELLNIRTKCQDALKTYASCGVKAVALTGCLSTIPEPEKLVNSRKLMSQ